MRTHCFALLLLLSGALALPGCASPEPTEVKSPGRYKVPFDFVWQTCLDQFKDGAWIPATQDRTLKVIETEWKLNLSPIAHGGRRNRLKVTITGTDEEGWNLACTQETEKNTNLEDPLNPEKADWSAEQNGGGLASMFLQNIDRRMTPNESWKQRAAR